MFLRSTNRKKDGKDHRYFSVVENQRVGADKTVQRTVLYLGEMNDTQQAAWRKTLDVFDENKRDYRSLSCFRRTAKCLPMPSTACRYGSAGWSCGDPVPLEIAGWRARYGANWD